MLDRALNIQKKKGKKVGEILVEMKIVENDTIEKALKNQAIEIILSLFKWKRGEYKFKVMPFIEKSMKSLAPIQIDGLIMEGVQMLDEWPLITELVPNENIIFEPTKVDSKDIEIIDETVDELPTSDKVFLSDMEVGLLRHINGQNMVKDLVEMGIFTKYKVYKSLYNLIQKQIIKRKEKPTVDDSDMQKNEEILLDKIDNTQKKINYIYFFIILFLLFMLSLSLFSPFQPFYEDNILVDKELIDNYFIID
jgi:hypothetical protein